MTRLAATLIGLLVLAFGIAAPAHADEPDLHPDIAYALAALPGGIPTGTTSAEWPDLGITYTIETRSARAVGTCATNLICAYRTAGLGGAKVTFSGCSTWSTTAFGGVGSVANARTSGWANARNSSGTVLKHVPYGTWADVPAGVTSIACGGNGITSA